MSKFNMETVCRTNSVNSQTLLWEQQLIASHVWGAEAIGTETVAVNVSFFLPISKGRTTLEMGHTDVFMLKLAILAFS